MRDLAEREDAVELSRVNRTDPSLLNSVQSSMTFVRLKQSAYSPARLIPAALLRCLRDCSVTVPDGSAERGSYDFYFTDWKAMHRVTRLSGAPQAK